MRPRMPAGRPFALQLAPGDPAVGGAEQSAARAAAGEVPGLAAHLPQGGVDDLGVVRIEGDVDRAGVLVAIEHLGPALAAVSGAEHAPLAVRPEGVADGGDHDDVRISGVDDDRPGLTRVFQPDVGPGLAGVRRFVDPVAIADVAPKIAFAGPDIDDVGIGRRDGHSPDGGDGLLVEDRLPGASGVVGLPDAAASRAEVEDVGLSRHARHRVTARPPRNGPILRQCMALNIESGAAGAPCANPAEAAPSASPSASKLELRNFVFRTPLRIFRPPLRLPQATRIRSRYKSKPVRPNEMERVFPSGCEAAERELR